MRAVLLAVLVLAACDSDTAGVLGIQNAGPDARVVVPDFYDTTFPSGAHSCTLLADFPPVATVLVIVGSDTTRRAFVPSLVHYWHLRITNDSVTVRPLSENPC
ncbi:MAG: hypothetical protein ACREMN_13680 [Gemmatimonadales bacterium]